MSNKNIKMDSDEDMDQVDDGEVPQTHLHSSMDDEFFDDADNASQIDAITRESDQDENEPQDGEPDSDLIVLDPDHPLMKRFQKTYKDHLLKQDEKVTLELRELLKEYDSTKKEREQLGVELYGIQQELARQQMNLEKFHDSYNEQSQFRKQCEQRLNEIKALYKQIMNDVQHQRQKASELQSEVENLSSKVLYMESLKTDVRSDINILKRAAEKAETEVAKAQLAKKRQDLLVNKLVTAVDHLRGDISMYEAQISAQRDDTKAAMRILTEASTELEAIELEKKQLLQQWNNSLIGMRKRDEALAANQQAVSFQRQEILAIDTELDGFKKQILKTQEENEQLTYMHHRIQSDIANMKKQITSCQNKYEALRIEYNTYNRTLHETEGFLNKTNLEINLKNGELINLRKQIEKEVGEKLQLEDQIMDKMQEQLTADKAAVYTKKMTDKIRKKASETERSLAEVENEISRDILEISNTASYVRNLQDVLHTINSAINEKNETITRIENEITKNNAIIEKKQGTIDQQGKKIDLIVNKQGDDGYSGPLEFQIKTLQRQIETKQNECLELQQYWLRQQGELVKVIKEAGEQATDIESKKKQATILMQKKLRLEGEITSEQNESKDIRRNIDNMHNEMSKLNLLIHKNRDKQTNLQQDNVLMENDFVATLKEAELESIKMQNNIEGMNEEKERLLNALVESERQIMLWEKKTQLAREARDAVDSEMGQGEIHSMKAEIHRMEVRYAQLTRQQEKLMQDMEKSVFKRECISVRGDAQAKMDRKRLGEQRLNKSAFHKKINELKKKIKQATHDADLADKEIQVLKERQQEVSTILEEKQDNGDKLQQSLGTIESEIEKMQELKQKNLNEIITKQQCAKYYTSLQSGKYTPLCKSQTSLQSEKEKQRNKFQSLSTIIDRLNNEYPEIQPVLRNVTLQLTNHEMARNVKESAREIQVD